MLPSKFHLVIQTQYRCNHVWQLLLTWTELFISIVICLPLLASLGNTCRLLSVILLLPKIFLTTLCKRNKMCNEAKCLNSLHNPVLKSLSSAMKVAIFRKPLLVYLETLRQVGKIDCAKGQMLKCSNTCMLDPFQNLFPFSYFLSLQLFLCQFFQWTLIKGLFLTHVAFSWCLHGFMVSWFHGQACRINKLLFMLYFILTCH